MEWCSNMRYGEGIVQSCRVRSSYGMVWLSGAFCSEGVAESRTVVVGQGEE